MGVETPRAFASFAKRWGVKGDFGGAHEGVFEVGLGDKWEDIDLDRGVPFDCDMLYTHR